MGEPAMRNFIGFRPPQRAVTLIELLIVVAMVTIIAAGLAFSASQTLTRARVAERTQHLEQSLAVAVDAISGDLAQAADHSVADSATLALTLAPLPGGEERAVLYRLGESGLTRRLTRGDQVSETHLITEAASGEFTAERSGLRLNLSVGFKAWHREIERRTEIFLAWPEVTGLRPRMNPP
jgi:prepilin-type N-terminal cleavage/methylation domain-containing protein